MKRILLTLALLIFSLLPALADDFEVTVTVIGLNKLRMTIESGHPGSRAVRAELQRVAFEYAPGMVIGRTGYDFKHDKAAIGFACGVPIRIDDKGHGSVIDKFEEEKKQREAQDALLTEAQINYEHHYAFVLFGFKDSEANGVKPAEPGRHYYMSFIRDCLDAHGLRDKDENYILRFKGDVDKVGGLPFKGNTVSDFFRDKDRSLWIWGPNGFFHCVFDDTGSEVND